MTREDARLTRQKQAVHSQTDHHRQTKVKCKLNSNFT
jgi:hypothetical protein